MTELLPVWPIWAGVGVILTAGLLWCLTSADRAGPRPEWPHRPTRMIGVSFCEDCQVVCSEGHPCFCCRERGPAEHVRGGDG